jgi:hypothetical protein
LYHLFNYSYFSPDRDGKPTLYYIINHSSDIFVDPDALFSRGCADIMKACGGDLDFEGLLTTLAGSLTSMLAVRYQIGREF